MTVKKIGPQVPVRRLRRTAKNPKENVLKDFNAKNLLTLIKQIVEKAAIAKTRDELKAAIKFAAKEAHDQLMREIGPRLSDRQKLHLQIELAKARIEAEEFFKVSA